MHHSAIPYFAAGWQSLNGLIVGTGFCAISRFFLITTPKLPKHKRGGGGDVQEQPPVSLIVS